MTHILPIASLLFGSALLLLAGGLQGLLLPLRGSIEGFSDTSLGLLGTGWAIGYIAGCVLTPTIVSRVGHIRTFGVYCSLAAIAVLLNLLIIDPLIWIPLRSISGFCFAGAAMVVESWLSERATPETRGRVFGLYTMINLGATTAGQMLLTLGDPAGFLFFAIGSIIYSMALLPTALSTAAAPVPLAQARLDPRALWRNSPVAVVSVFLAGMSNSAFGTLGAVYGRQIGLSVTEIATMMSLALLVGALVQIPVGMLSDRMDRRIVLTGLTGVACLIGSALSFAGSLPAAATIALVSAFGGMIYSMYPVIVAHANDHSPPGEFLKTSGGLLMLFGAGSIVGPLSAALLMSLTKPGGLFNVTSLAHLAIVGFTIWRMTQRAAVAPENKEDFISMPSGVRFSTPETLAMDPRAEEEREELMSEMGTESRDKGIASDD
ncbi:MFS transporter [Rhizobiales bacterium]|uniref:MFS transporter n=1 Tax=Hongsoonwoonella zoysiae TaxID=2821844 RepID=UPI00155FBF60|nr:MFS transporter [Hongsoonwoonella zoysiae]NRG19853.1 MFS transporter [Hongsoonwoonella zoysiae]